MPDLRLIDRSRTATTLRHGSLPIGSISNPRRVVTTRTGAAVTPHEKLSGYALPDVCSPPVAGAGRRVVAPDYSPREAQGQSVRADAAKRGFPNAFRL